MEKNKLYTKDEVLKITKQIKQQQAKYNKVIQKKPNVKSDGIDGVVDWLKDILVTFKK